MGFKTGKYGNMFREGKYGDLVDSTLSDNRTVKLNLAKIAFGVPVSFDANEFIIIANQTSKIVGITAFRQTSTQDGYLKGDAAVIYTRGHIWVKPQVAILANQPAFVDANGHFTNLAQDAAEVNNNPVGTFLRDAVAGQFAALNFDANALNM